MPLITSVMRAGELRGAVARGSPRVARAAVVLHEHRVVDHPIRTRPRPRVRYSAVAVRRQLHACDEARRHDRCINSYADRRHRAGRRATTTINFVSASMRRPRPHVAVAELSALLLAGRSSPSRSRTAKSHRTARAWSGRLRTACIVELRARLAEFAPAASGSSAWTRPSCAPWRGCCSLRRSAATTATRLAIGSLIHELIMLKRLSIVTDILQRYQKCFALAACAAYNKKAGYVRLLTSP